MTEPYHVWLSVGSVYRNGRFGGAAWVERLDKKTVLAEAIPSAANSFEMAWKTLRWVFSKLYSKTENIIVSLRDDEIDSFWKEAKAGKEFPGELGEFAKDIQAHANWKFKVGEEAIDFDRYLQIRCYVVDVKLD